MTGVFFIALCGTNHDSTVKQGAYQVMQYVSDDVLNLTQMLLLLRYPNHGNMCQIVLRIDQHLLLPGCLSCAQAFGYALCVASLVTYALHTVLYKKYLYLLDENSEVKGDKLHAFLVDNITRTTTSARWGCYPLL